MNQKLSKLEDIGNRAKKKLIKRLYRNSSLNRLGICQKQNLINSSFGNHQLFNSYSSNQLLVPSFVLGKLKHTDWSQRSLEISHGKILITKPNESSMLYQNDSKKKLFKKLPNLNGEKRIIPQQLINSVPDQLGIQQKNKADKLLKGIKNNRGDRFDDDQNLTPQDFIQLIQADSTITNQFCYLKKLSHPYDLKITQFQDKNQSRDSWKRSSPGCPDQYITISSRGVTYFGKEQSRFVPLHQWKKQAKYFKKLINLDFFKKFRILKTFSSWKKYLRKTAMKTITSQLKQTVLVTDKYLRLALIQTRKACITLESDISYCKLDDCENAMNFPKFKISQQNFLQNEFEKRIQQIEKQIKVNLLAKMSVSMQQFKEQNKITSGSKTKGIPLLIGDQKNLQMPYTKQATLRTQQDKFQRFLKLIDLLIINSKINMMEQSTDSLAKKIIQENDTYQRQVVQTNYKDNFKGKQYLQCYMILDIDREYITLKPTNEQINILFEDIVHKSVLKLCRNHKRIMEDNQILSVIYDCVQQAPKCVENDTLKIILTSEDRQEKLVHKLMQQINRSYSFIEQYSKKFIHFSRIYFDNIKKLEFIKLYQAKDYQIIKLALQNWKSQLGQISSLNNQHQSALFVLDLKNFKDRINNCIQDCIEKIKKRLPQLFKIAVQDLKNQLLSSLKLLEIQPLGIVNYIKFQNNKSIVSQKLDDYAIQLAEINCIWIIMKSNANSSTSAVVAALKKQEKEISQIQANLNQIRNKIQQAQMNQKFLQCRAQEQTILMMEKLNESISKLYFQVSNTNFNKDNPDQVIEFVRQIRINFGKILKEREIIISYQQFLNMEESNRQIIIKFETFLQTFQKIWLIKNKLILFEKNIKNNQWNNIIIQDKKDQLQGIALEAVNLKKYINLNQNKVIFQIQENQQQILDLAIIQIKNLKIVIEEIQSIQNQKILQKQNQQIGTSEVDKFSNQQNNIKLSTLKLNQQSQQKNEL